MPPTEAAHLILAYVVFPLAVAAGLADWACYRATGIGGSSGLKENLLHWLMFAELGLGVLAVAFLQVNAAVLLLVLGVFVVHEITVWADLRYSTPRRPVRPVEQMVHSFQELFPVLAWVLLAAAHWDQALGLVGQAPADWGLRLKAQPLPLPALAAGAAAVLLFNVLPLAQETWSCLRPRTRATPAPR
jgi:hypothetical protein